MCIRDSPGSGPRSPGRWPLWPSCPTRQPGASMSDSPTAPIADAQSADTPRPTPAGIDPRGPRFGAAITAALLAITLLLGTGPAATAVLTVVALLFVLGVARGVQGLSLIHI